MYTNEPVWIIIKREDHHVSSHPEGVDEVNARASLRVRRRNEWRPHPDHEMINWANQQKYKRISVKAVKQLFGRGELQEFSNRIESNIAAASSIQIARGGMVMEVVPSPVVVRCQRHDSEKLANKIVSGACRKIGTV